MRVTLRAKFEVLSAFFVFLLTVFAMQANAQSAGVYSVYNPQIAPTSQSYFMGSVRLPGSNFTMPQAQNLPTNIQTNIVPVSSVQNVCGNLLLSYHKFGDRGADVAALQLFLNQYNGANLNGQGFYGQATMQEVKNLQSEYGIKVTGAQYEKTTSVINSLKCGSLAKRNRMIYRGGYGSVSGAVSVSTPRNITSLGNVYPNAGTVVRNYGKSPTATTQMMLATTSANNMNSNAANSLAGSVDSDFQKIKDNYKAYILVFVLVLALFWFLRKAATE